MFTLQNFNAFSYIMLVFFTSWFLIVYPYLHIMVKIDSNWPLSLGINNSPFLFSWMQVWINRLPLAWIVVEGHIVVTRIPLEFSFSWGSEFRESVSFVMVDRKLKHSAYSYIICRILEYPTCVFILWSKQWKQPL